MTEDSCEHEGLATRAASVKQKQWGRELIAVTQNLQNFLSSRVKRDQDLEAHMYSLRMDVSWVSVH